MLNKWDCERLNQPTPWKIGVEMMNPADEFKYLVQKQTGIPKDELSCPRAKSFMTPCIARDGDLTESDDGRCVGCLVSTKELLTQEQDKHITQ